MPRTFFDAQCISNDIIAPDVRQVSFSLPESPNFSFTPGQFINFHITVEGKEYTRSFSIANTPQNNDLEIAIAYVKDGLASELLFHLQPGDMLKTSGPYGRLVLKEDDQPKRYFFIATGTGITPYRSMCQQLQQRLQQNADLAVYLIQGVRHPTDLIYGDEFIAIAQKEPRFHYHACYSRSQPEQLRPFEHQGRVTQYIEQIEFNPEKDIVYLCGNPDMIDDAFSYLTERGFDHKSVRREKYVFSKPPLTTKK